METETQGVRQRAAEELIKTAHAAKEFGVKVINGFTGSSIWHLVYSFPPVLPGQIDAGYEDFAKRWKPILDEFVKCDVKFGLEVHPTEIAFDIASWHVRRFMMVTQPLVLIMILHILGIKVLIMLYLFIVLRTG